jgi:hypothetical protein
MTVSSPPVPQRLRRRMRLLPVLAILAALAGCDEIARVEIPTELPLRMHDQLFAIEWALQREPSVVRGVGRVTPSIDSEARLTLGLFGLDASGRIVSRGTAHLHSDFASRSIPFTVTLTPTGRESTFELRVLNYHIPGLRMS